ncbi:hypothetical protein ACIA8O_37300 [Kitasatospora sp. NPDC051853]|uniref:hypothetical protein n=1 Tax=Kitasatospora sp. NPDC051853 TaxID=3364058 RepID=UPI0037AC2A8F
MSEPWRRLTDRLNPDAEPEALFEGVPEHLDGFVRTWVKETLSEEELTTRLVLRLRLPSSLSAYKVAALGTNDPLQLLEIVDATLSLLPLYGIGVRVPFHVRVRDLDILLTEGGSAWAVAEDQLSLQRRVDDTAVAAAGAARAGAASAEAAGSAADHLKAAWQAAYGISPSPHEAYSQAIKAVESAAHAVVEPNNTMATLGSMIGVVRNSPAKFKLAIDGGPNGGDPAPLLAMLQLLWQGQTSRHGAQTVTRPESQEAAQMAVHLAVTLVQWFTSGAVVRVP